MDRAGGPRAPPENWKPCRSPDGEIYYFNFSNGESVWDHPCDEYCHNMYAEEKKKLEEKRQTSGAAATQQGKEKTAGLPSGSNASAALPATAATVEGQPQRLPRGLKAPLGGVGKKRFPTG